MVRQCHKYVGGLGGGGTTSAQRGMDAVLLSFLPVGGKRFALDRLQQGVMRVLEDHGNDLGAGFSERDRILPLAVLELVNYCCDAKPRSSGFQGGTTYVARITGQAIFPLLVSVRRGTALTDFTPLWVLGPSGLVDFRMPFDMLLNLDAKSASTSLSLVLDVLPCVAVRHQLSEREAVVASRSASCAVSDREPVERVML